MLTNLVISPADWPMCEHVHQLIGHLFDIQHSLPNDMTF